MSTAKQREKRIKDNLKASLSKDETRTHFMGYYHCPELPSKDELTR